MNRFGIREKHDAAGNLSQPFGPCCIGNLFENYDSACGQLLNLHKTSGPLTDEENENAISLYAFVHDI